jgi:hypothetical protein
MKKLRLELDELRVESFDAAGDAADEGTVVAHAKETDPRVCPYTYNWHCSVAIQCEPTMYDTCEWTCVWVEGCGH